MVGKKKRWDFYLSNSKWSKNNRWIGMSYNGLLTSINNYIDPNQPSSLAWVRVPDFSQNYPNDKEISFNLNCLYGSSMPKININNDNYSLLNKNDLQIPDNITNFDTIYTDITYTKFIYQLKADGSWKSENNSTNSVLNVKNLGAIPNDGWSNTDMNKNIKGDMISTNIFKLN